MTLMTSTQRAWRRNENFAFLVTIFPPRGKVRIAIHGPDNQLLDRRIYEWLTNSPIICGAKITTLLTLHLQSDELKEVMDFYDQQVTEHFTEAVVQEEPC